MLPYAAYLRVYEPLEAFRHPERALWTAYAASRDRPERAVALDSEHTDAVRRLVMTPPTVVPQQESGHAYLRRVDGVAHVCPWQTRLRSWLAFARFRGSLPIALADVFVPRSVADQAAADFEQYKREMDGSAALRTHILTACWRVPIPWFMPFDPAERTLVLGDDQDAAAQESGRDAGPTTAAATRNLVYVTPMAQARQRLARALVIIQRGLGEGTATAEVEELGRWLAEFHPRSIVELDYGGLVHLLDDHTLRSDESVAEVTAALAGLDSGEAELAVAMYQRLTSRWRAVQARESAN